MGNDDDDLEGDFESWKDQRLWPLLLSKRASVLQRELSAVNKAHRLPDCQYKITYHDNKATSGSDVSLDKVHSSSRHYFTAVDCPVTTVRELRSSQDPGSTVHVEVDISKHKQLTYQTADNLGVLPVNSNTTVEKVAKALQYDLDAVFSLSAADNHEWHGAPFPMPCTVRECLTQYCDLQGALRRSDLKLLAAYCQDSTDQKALQRMASKEGRAEYKEKILESFVGLADLLEKCPSISMPLEHFINACPPLQSRFFTISSSSSVHPDTIHLTVSVTQHERKDGSFFKGLCSNYLASRKPSTHTIRVFHRPSTFRLPADASRPLIMIGPGTGIAPMRALLQERSYQRTKRKMNVGSNILYFGCKRRSEDFLYEDELKQFQQDGVLDVLRVAFSREQDQKVYVQHLLLQNAEETWNLIDGQKAHIFVCGGVKMGQDVSEALKEIVVSHSDLSSNAAKEYLSKLSHEGRFVQELWA
jgi:NADPH-ferrihemoprotein reductase